MNNALPTPPLNRLTKADAVMGIAMAAAAADGRLRRREVERLRLMAHISPLFRSIPDVDSYMEGLARELRAAGVPAFVARAADSLEPRLRETAYAWSAEIVRADESVSAEEHDYLENLRRTLGIHTALASKIRAVTAIRGREA